MILSDFLLSLRISDTAEVNAVNCSPKLSHLMLDWNFPGLGSCRRARR